MYCPVCGAESAEGLKFCKHCGSGLTAPLNVEYVRPIKITGSVWAIAVMAFLSFGALFGSVVALAGMGIRSEDILGPIFIAGSLAVFRYLRFDDSVRVAGRRHYHSSCKTAVCRPDGNPPL